MILVHEVQPRIGYISIKGPSLTFQPSLLFSGGKHSEGSFIPCIRSEFFYGTLIGSYAQVLHLLGAQFSTRTSLLLVSHRLCLGHYAITH